MTRLFLSFKSNIFSLLECWSHKSPSWLWSFWHKNSGCTIKERAVSTKNYCDTVSTLTQTSSIMLSSSERRSYSWVSNYSVLHWESVDHQYWYLQEIFDSRAVDLPSSETSLQKLRKKDVINQKNLSPKTENWSQGTSLYFTFLFNAVLTDKEVGTVADKRQIFSLWLMNESTVRESSSVSTSIEFVTKFKWFTVVKRNQFAVIFV